jgi:hypothetical protein
MSHTTIAGYAKRQPDRKHPMAVALTRFIARHWRSGMALCALLLLAELPAMAQNTATVMLFTDTNSVDSSGNAGLGAGHIDSSGNMDLRYVLQDVIALGGTWTIKFSSACTVSTPCTIVLTNPLPPITSNTGNPLILTIDGGEFGQVIIDGAGAYRAFFVDNAQVTLANLKIQNALAQGGAGGAAQSFGGGGGAGLGAGVFVNQSTANLSVQNTYFLNCQVIGGAGGYGAWNSDGGGSGGGGGMAFKGGDVGCWVTCLTPYAYGAGGGGILTAGNAAGAGNAGTGGNGGGGGGADDTQLSTPWVNGGSAYGDNAAGGTNQGTNNGANGGFGGGGGGASEYLDSSLNLYSTNGGSGGFGGGGGGGYYGYGGFGGGNGGGVSATANGGDGGSAYGPSIFVNTGTVTIGNSGYYNDSTHTAATAGQGSTGSGSAGANGSADGTAAYNYGGSIDGGSPNGTLPSALPATHFIVGTPATMLLGHAATITVIALDSNNNQTIAYNGTANLTATDGNSKPITVSPSSLAFYNGMASSSAMTLSIVDWDITVTATDSNWSYITGTSGDITMSETILLSPTSATLPGGTVGIAYSQNFVASGGSGSYSYALASGSSLPAGLSLSSAGALTGIPTTAGTTGFTVVATDTVYTNSSGTHYTGSQSYSLTVSQGTPVVVVSLSSGINPVFVDNALTFKAAVTNTGNTPTGTVTFYDNGAVVTSCVGVTLSAGVATCTINTSSSPLAVGTNLITASYSGDTNFIPVPYTASTGYSETVADFSISASITTYTVIPGNAATYTFTVSPVSPSTVYPTAINLSISGLPRGASYYFTSSSIASCSSSCTTTVTLIIDTVLNNTTSERQPGTGGNLATRWAPFSLALLLLPFVGRLRKTGKRFSRMLPILLLLVASLAAMAGMSGCGSTVGYFGQAQKTYTVGVTGTSGTLSHTSNVTLIVE